MAYEVDDDTLHAIVGRKMLITGHVTGTQLVKQFASKGAKVVLVGLVSSQEVAQAPIQFLPDSSLVLVHVP